MRSLTGYTYRLSEPRAHAQVRTPQHGISQHCKSCTYGPRCWLICKQQMTPGSAHKTPGRMITRQNTSADALESLRVTKKFRQGRAPKGVNHPCHPPSKVSQLHPVIAGFHRSFCSWCLSLHSLIENKMQTQLSRSRLQQARPAVRARVSRQQRVVVQAKKSADGPSIAVVGVTGAVGQEFLQVSRADVAARITH